MKAISTTIEPWLSVRDSAKAVDFYKRAFEATELFKLEDPDNAVVARLAIGGASFWLSDESPEYENYSPQSTAGKNTVRIILTVTDPEAVVANAVLAGAILLCAVKEDNGWLVGRIADPFGHHWEIGRPVDAED